MEWVLLYVLWAPVLGAVLLRAVVEDPERRRRALRAYAYTALFLHPLAVFPVLVSYEVALLVLAGFDAALFAIVIATWRDERALGEVLAAIRVEPAEGARHAARWMRELAARHGGSTHVEHAIACAQALEAHGLPADADAILEAVPRGTVVPLESARLALAHAMLAIGRGDAERARAHVARALGRAPAGAPETHTARALAALLDAQDGMPRRALARVARVPSSLASAIDRAIVALARAHALAALGEIAHARAIVRALDDEARAHAERLSRACGGPGSAWLAALDRQADSPYR